MSSSATHTPHMKPAGSELKYIASECEACSEPIRKLSVCHGIGWRSYSCSSNSSTVGATAIDLTLSEIVQASWTRRSVRSETAVCLPKTARRPRRASRASDPSG